MSTHLSRRDMLRSAGIGFGYLALAGLSTQEALGSMRVAGPPHDPLQPRPGHHPARAKRVIFLFMHGGPSHLDTFDYKPRLQRDDGGELPFAPAPGTLAGRRLLASPWKFARYGQSGAWVSELFP